MAEVCSSVFASLTVNQIIPGLNHGFKAAAAETMKELVRFGFQGLVIKTQQRVT